MLLNILQTSSKKRLECLHVLQKVFTQYCCNNAQIRLRMQQITWQHHTLATKKTKCHMVQTEFLCTTAATAVAHIGDYWPSEFYGSVNKKFELTLMRRVRAYSSSCSHVISV